MTFPSNYIIITYMKLNLIAIGNSKGIRIPSAVLKQCDIDGDLELEVKNDRIILKPVRKKPRSGWDEAFKLMRKRGEDALLMGEDIDRDEDDWQWK